MTMMNVSILDEEFADNASMQIRIKQLEDEVESLKSFQQWMDDEMYGVNCHVMASTNQHITRAKKVADMYQAIYGDIPICDCCDGRTGFFLEIDNLYDAIMNRKWLIKILRWGNYYYNKFLHGGTR